MTTSFVTSLSLTSIANAFVFSNMTSLILLCVKAALGRPTVRLEVIGVIIGFIGALICSGDESRHSSAVGHDNESQKRLGDLLALSASFGMAVYLSIAKDLRSKCNLFVFTFALFVCCQFFILSFMMVRGEPVEFSTHKNYGVLGWVNSDMNRLPVELYMVLVCSLMGTIAYVAVLQYFDSVVVSTVMLMEPTVAALTGYLAGVDTLPGLQTWLGDTFVVIGSTMVIYCGATKDEKKQQCQNTRMDSPTKAMHESLPYLHVHDQ
jgi:drug/metabolite transporter (DMT)-like permease